jgi:hypothetical protein
MLTGYSYIIFILLLLLLLLLLVYCFLSTVLKFLVLFLSVALCPVSLFIMRELYISIKCVSEMKDGRMEGYFIIA